uniref:Reverse transcriptase domain-containing protein n=1 Tax=Tanacetum cinerariifolium TaxID=118510 RepID=A0A6L2LNF4_TANCI|nr:reverse transcriptase domain-containing protein [Tanacetum cinerariifolium]
MTRLLEKDTPFIFSKECIEAFQSLKKKLTKAPILVAPDWDLPFELMCDASDFAIEIELLAMVEKSCNMMKCLKMPSKFVRSLTYEASISWGHSRLHEGTSLELPVLSLVIAVRTFSMTNSQRSCLKNLGKDRRREPCLWSNKLDDALWAFRTAFKTPIRCTPYKLVYEKACHISIELEHKAYRALKHCNYDLLTMGDHRRFSRESLRPAGLDHSSLLKYSLMALSSYLKPTGQISRSSSKLSRDQTSNPTSSTNTTPKGRTHRSSKQKVENSNFEEHLPPVATMVDNRTMSEMLRASTEGCAEAIVVPPILAEQFELKHGLINMMTSEQFFRLENDNPHDDIRWFNKITSTIKYRDVPNSLRLILLRKLVLPAEVLIRTTSVLPPVAALSQNSRIISMDTFQQPQATTIRGQDFSRATPLPTQKVNSKPSPLAVVLLLMDLPFPLLPNPLLQRMLKQKQQEKDKVQIQKFWQMFKQLHLNITLVEALVLMPKYQKMLKALLSNKEKLQELANTSLNENCSVAILKKLPEKLSDPGKFLIPCGFSELKCKALADLAASINLMPLSVWKELGLHKLIPTRMTLKLANRAICTPDGIARDVFVSAGKFTFPADFVIVDYESDPRVSLILGRPLLRTARALIDVHGEEMILHDGDKRLTLNMKHDTASYSNHPQRESINLINIFNVSSEDFLEGCNDIHPHFDDNPLSGSTTYSSNSLLEEFTDELALIKYPPDHDDNLQFDIESDLKEIEFLLYQGKDSNLKDSIIQTDLANLDDYFVDPVPEMFTDEHTLDYSSPPIFDVYYDDFLEVESDADNVYDDPFDSNGEKIKESKLLIDELDLPCDFLPYSEYDSFNS